MKLLLFVGVLAVCLLRLPVGSSRPLPQIDVDIVIWEEVELTDTVNRGEEETTNTSVPSTPFAEGCQEYCSLTYPQHTYSEPTDYQACTTGCRTAQLDAFIAWPLQPDNVKCKQACQEVYSEEDRMFACSMGCKTPTIDSVLPYRSHLYGEGGRGNWTGVDIILGPSIDNALSSLFNTVFSLDTEPVIFDDLSEHAENMEILMVPYLRSDITILTSDGVYTYREYSSDISGENILGDNFNARPPDYQFGKKRTGCVWLLHRTTLNKIVLVLSAALIITALTICCLSVCSPEKNVAEMEKKVPPTISSIPPLSTKKAPYDVGSEFILPEKLPHGNFRQIKEKITML